MQIHNNFFDPLQRIASSGDTFPSPPPSQTHYGQPDAIVAHPSVCRVVFNDVNPRLSKNHYTLPHYARGGGAERAYSLHSRT